MQTIDQFCVERDFRTSEKEETDFSRCIMAWTLNLSSVKESSGESWEWRNSNYLEEGTRHWRDGVQKTWLCVRSESLNSKTCARGRSG